MAKPKKRTTESDPAYFLKLVMYLILGAQWLFIVDEGLTRQIPVPIGLIIGLLFAAHEHFKIDRKLEYVVLLIAMLIGLVSHIGLYITLGAASY